MDAERLKNDQNYRVQARQRNARRFALTMLVMASAAGVVIHANLEDFWIVGIGVLAVIVASACLAGESPLNTIPGMLRLAATGIHLMARK